MPLLTIDELRAIVGETGADLSDEQLLHMDAVADVFAQSIVGQMRDRANPAAAAARRQQERLQLERDLAPRRRKYEREKARARARRSA